MTVVAVVLIGTLLYVVLQPGIGWPAEGQRFVHPGGFSVAQPEGWERHVTDSSDGRSQDSVRFLPIRSVGSPGYFSVTKVAAAVTEPERATRGYSATTFAGQPAWERRTTHDRTHEHARGVIFERDGAWFEVAIRRPDSESIDSGVWKAYAESFRVEPVRSAAASRPTTIPLP